MYWMPICEPRFSSHRVITLPTWSGGVRMLARMIGSRTSSIWLDGGRSAGLSSGSTLPSVRSTSYTTVGAVVNEVLRTDGKVLPLDNPRSEEHTSELQSRGHLVCRLLLEKKKT